MWLLIVVLCVVVLVLFLVQTPMGQRIVKDKAVTFLQQKLGTPVRVGTLSIDFPNDILLRDVYFEDQARDTLLMGDTLAVNISLFKLLSNEVEINSVDLRGINAKLKLSLADSTFNFDYIIKAFASEKKKDPNAEEKAPLKLSVSKINLQRIRFLYEDEVHGTLMKTRIGHFKTKIESLDLDSLKFDIPAIALSNAEFFMHQRKALSEEAVRADTNMVVSDSKMPDLKLENLDLKNIKVRYDNEISHLNTDLQVGKLNVVVNNLDLNKRKIDLKEITLSETKGSFALGRTAQKAVKSTSQEIAHEANTGWRVALGQLNLSQVDFKYDDLSRKQDRRGVDFSHLDLTGVNIRLTDFIYSTDEIKGSLKDMSLSESSGLDLKRLATDFFYGPKAASLRNLDLQTSRSLLRDNLEITYASLGQLKKSPGEIGIKANLKNSKISFRDILLFQPDLRYKTPFDKYPNATMSIHSKMYGKLSDLHIPNVELSGLGSTRLSASAHITGLPDVKNAIFDFNFREISSTRKDLLALLPKGTLPDNIQLPERFTLKGFFKGDMANFNTDLTLNTSFGFAKVKARLKNGDKKGREIYTADVSTTNFDLGKLLKNPEKYGTATVVAHINGIGTDPKTANATFKAKVINAVYNNYKYHNLYVNGEAKKGIINAVANMADPNATFSANAYADFNNKYPKVKAVLNIDSLDLQRLNFMKDEFRFHGLVTADLETADPDYLNGDIKLTNTLFVTKGKRYQLDTVSLVATSTADSNSLVLRSEFMTANIRGKYQLTNLEPAIQSVLNKYYDTGGQVITKNINTSQRFIFDAEIYKSPLVAELLPQLTELEKIKLDGRFNYSENLLQLNVVAPGLTYNENVINGLVFNIDTESDSLQYDLTLDRLLGKQIQLLNTSIKGAAVDDQLTFDLKIKNDVGINHYDVQGGLKTEQGNYLLHLDPDGVVLDNTKWQVSEGNQLRFGKDGLHASDFALINGDQSLTINSLQPGKNSPLKIDFEKFKIETITRIASKDSLLVGGTINGEALLKDIATNLNFTSNLKVNDFNFRGDTLGNISLQANNSAPNTIYALATVSGKGNDIKLVGNFFPKAVSDKMAFDVDINRLNMSTIEGFTMGNITDASGNIDGKMHLGGSPNKPLIRGEMHFDEVRANVTKFNNYFTLKNERLRFDQRGINVDQLTVRDSSGNRAILDGMIFTDDYRDYRFALTMVSNDFMVMNSTRENNSLYYGKLFIDTDLRIGGTLSAPVIDGDVKVMDKTDLALIVPQKDPQIESREGIVEFIDMDNPILNDILTNVRDSLTKSNVRGIDLAVNLTVDKEATLNLIIDEGNGDFLRIKGAANLTAALDPSGKTTLVGNYEVQEGSYSLTYNFIKRDFQINKGSTITWTGEPLTANVNVTAKYIANTAPYNLVEGFLGEATASVRNTYKQKLPFEVWLNMTGELLKPEISFDIQLPRKNYGVSSDIINTVDTRLIQLRNEPSELNKQVFAILILNRFIADNPFQTSSDAFSAESLARESVSKLLTEQLNQIAADLITGFDLNFDLNSAEDYTTGELKNRTDLNVGLSKRLLNDRLKVSVGSTFELEGPQRTNQKTSNIAGDVSAEYQLSKDGRYLVKVYRKDEYIIVQGQVVETGISFQINADYNRVKEIFARKTEGEKMQRQKLRSQRRQDRIDERNAVKIIDSNKAPE